MSPVMGALHGRNAACLWWSAVERIPAVPRPDGVAEAWARTVPAPLTEQITGGAVPVLRPLRLPAPVALLANAGLLDGDVVNVRLENGLVAELAPAGSLS